jgi:hypothetical protein
MKKRKGGHKNKHCKRDKECNVTVMWTHRSESGKVDSNTRLIYRPIFKRVICDSAHINRLKFSDNYCDRFLYAEIGNTGDYMIQQFCVKLSLGFSMFCDCSKCSTRTEFLFVCQEHGQKLNLFGYFNKISGTSYLVKNRDWR